MEKRQIINGLNERNEASMFLVDAENPYLGLTPFEEVHKDFFFGRDQEIESLLRLVRRDVLTVLFSESGLGKTSLLKAGLFPELRKQHYLPLWIRLSYDQNSNLENQIKDIVKQAVQEHCLETPPPDEHETLWEYFHRVPFWSQRNRLLTPILAFDQFEELFTLGREISRHSDFLQQLADLVENQMPESVIHRLRDTDEDLPFNYDQPPVKIILSLREDYLGYLEDLRVYMPSLAHSRYRLLPMNGEQAFQAVTKPAVKLNLVDDDVATGIVRFVAGAHNQNTETSNYSELIHLEIAPALLSLICKELNELRRNNDEEKISSEIVNYSKDDILSKFYQDSLKNKLEMQKFIEDELITASGYRNIRTIEEATQKKGITEAQINDLVECRLLRKEERRGQPNIELIHDVIAQVAIENRALRKHRETIQEINLQYRKTAFYLFALLIVIIGFIFIGWQLGQDNSCNEFTDCIKTKMDNTLKNFRDLFKA